MTKINSCINLTEGFAPYTNYSEFCINFESFTFAGGEVHIKITSESIAEDIIITSRITNSDDLMRILMAKDALHRLGARRFSLVLPYIPYARQDRVCNEGEAFTLKVFADIINSCRFDKVYCLDAHSEVAPALINNCINLSNHLFVRKSIEHIILNKDTSNEDQRDLIIVSPDAGSNKKIKDLMKHLTTVSVTLSNVDLVKCDKTRDLKTGGLTGFDVYADDLKGVDCILVDDICSNGGTFLGLADELKKKNAGDLYLVVSHGEFGKEPNKTIEKLLSKFKRIYTTDSIQKIDNSNVITITIQEITST